MSSYRFVCTPLTIFIQGFARKVFGLLILFLECTCFEPFTTIEAIVRGPRELSELSENVSIKIQ